MDLGSSEKSEQDKEKELADLIETFSTIQEALFRLNQGAATYKDKDQLNSRFRQISKLLEKQLSLLDRLKRIE